MILNQTPSPALPKNPDAPVISITSNQVNVLQVRQFKMTPTLVACPNCGQIGFTKIEKSCNILDFLFYCFFTCCWAVSNSWEDKAFNCQNADHYCSSCGKLLFQYKAC